MVDSSTLVPRVIFALILGALLGATSNRTCNGYRRFLGNTDNCDLDTRFTSGHQRKSKVAARYLCNATVFYGSRKNHKVCQKK